MSSSGLSFIVALSVFWAMLFVPVNAHAKSSHRPLATRDAATVHTAGDLNPPPGVAMLIGAQGSSNKGFRARPVIACDQFVSKDVRGPGAFGLARAPGKHVYVCSYSISNGSELQDVQFVSGTEAASGSGHECTRGRAITGKFHLISNQFISQGGGIGSLFMTTGQGLCVTVSGHGHVSVNVTYASF